MTARTPEEAQALQHDTDVPTLSLADTQANMLDAADRADIGQATICAPSSVTLNLIDVLLIETMGRRKEGAATARRAADGRTGWTCHR